MDGGILNFLAWGTGYLYIGRRLCLGGALFFFIAALSLGGSMVYQNFYQAVALTFLAWLVVSIALARDAYLEAREKAKRGE